MAPVVSGHTFRLQIFGLRIKYLIDRQALNVRKYKSGVQWRGTVEGYGGGVIQPLQRGIVVTRI